MGVPFVAQWLMNQLGSMRRQVQSLTLLSGLGIWCCGKLWCRSQTQLGSRIAVLLWLWCRLAAAAPIWPLAWEPSYATSLALKRKKTKKQKKTRYAPSLKWLIDGYPAKWIQSMESWDRIIPLPLLRFLTVTKLLNLSKNCYPHEEWRG